VSTDARVACALLLLSVGAVGACEPASDRDAGRLDAAIPETGSLDAAFPETGSLDGGSLDAASLDAASLDAWGMDASWGSCSVGGVTGTCLDVSLCTGDRMSVPGFCPGPAGIQCCLPRGDAGPVPDAGPTPDAGLCDPADMSLPNVGLTEAAGEGGCPAGMVPVTDAFCVDRYEASLVEVLADGSTLEWSPYHNPGTRRVRALSRAGAVPQGYIDGVRAAAACSEAGKRLCTDTEWLRACQGSAGTTYPYGNTRSTGVCNDHRDLHPAVERFGTSADWIWSRLGDACINQLPMSLARTGAFSGCQSEPGAFDMMGNVHEWTSDAAGTFRGGFYVDTVINGNGCLYRTTAHDSSHWDYSTGFRCCADR
jgi:sulfatase modifying factor 1